MNQKTNLRKAPPVPSWFEEELRMISPNLKLMWMPQIQKFAVVTPVPHTISKKMYHVEAIIHRDNNYKEPDMAVINELKRRMQEKNRLRNLDEIPKKMEREERERIEKAEKRRIEMQHDFMRKAYHFMKDRKTFVLSGNSPGSV